ncbi:hypothetical protein VNO78_13244 [Psophocarpus tetragonolobus]|uniref:Peptidase A1 domain-containing protein n=1 Tax=Psophocarpus tetragonolobus TaxID=3891 RepID=A0AAN9SYQ8_PSOTE
MSAEKISFGSKGVVFPKFTFGCVYYNGENVDLNKMNTGLVGLGVGPLSLISQLGDQIGRKFSYCFAPLDSNSTSKMSFGDEATFKGKGVMSTPLIVKSSSPSYYYLNLEAISFGDKPMKVSKGEIDGNIIIDSGSTYTVLEQRIYKNFVSLMKEVLAVEEEKVASEPNTFCFRNKDNREVFPETVFHFTGGVKVEVDASRMLYSSDDKVNVVCSRVSVADEVGSIFGNHAQVGYHVEYDLNGGMISFAPADCAI